MKKRIIVIGISVIAMYVGVYLALTLCGGNRVVTGKPHNMLYEPAGQAYDLQMWFPAGIMFRTDHAVDGHPRQVRCNVLGVIFSPLVQLDRRCWHHTAVIIEELEPEPIDEKRGEQSPGGDSLKAAPQE